MESRSERDGLSALARDDVHMLSVGVSTGGDAEIKMLQNVRERNVIATTLDVDGLELVRQKVESAGLSERIDLRIEDIASNELPYAAESFDFVYARLVLHYLTAQQLEVALRNIFRVLKQNSRMFVVVRSTESQELKGTKVIGYDEVTHMTTYLDPSGEPAVRYFHTVESISNAVEEAGLTIEHIDTFDEDLSTTFSRTDAVRSTNTLIELIASKQ